MRRVGPAQPEAWARDIRVLVVTAEADTRQSTQMLERMVAAVNRQPGCQASIWLLREHDTPAWPGVRVVDDLRKRWYARPLSLVGLERPAGLLRGIELRRWFREVDPDVVVLDDELGTRLLPSAPRTPLVALRPNPEPPRYAYLEPAAEASGDLVLRPAPEADDHLLTSRQLFLEEELEPIAAAAAEARSDVRSRFGLDGSVPLVVGWGDHAWVDGPDLFVRCLWFLQDRHGIEAHGLWIGPTGDHVEMAELRDEARRCGVADRMHFIDDRDEPMRWAGDVTFLPYRVPATAHDLHRAAAADQTVVTFAPATVHGDWVAEVPFLDIEAAAGAVAAALSPRTALWADQVSVDAWADRFVAAVRTHR